MAQKWGRGGHGYQEYDENDGEYGEDKEGTTYSRDKGDKPEKIKVDTEKPVIEIDAGTGKPVEKRKAATTLSEAEKEAQSFSNYANYTGLTVYTANIINDTLSDLNSKYNLNIQSVTTNARLRNTIAQAGFDKLEISPKNIQEKLKTSEEWHKALTEAIKIREERLNDPKYQGYEYYGYRQKLKKDIRDFQEQQKFSRDLVSTGMTVEEAARTNIAHEFGHLISTQKFGLYNRSFYLRQPNANSIEAQRKIDKVVDAFNQAKRTGDIYNLSYYASTNKDEFYAESFAAYESGLPLPDYIVKMIKETSQ